MQGQWIGYTRGLAEICKNDMFNQRYSRSLAGSAGLSLCLAALLAGCGREEVRIYQIPKEVPQPETMPANAAHAHGTPAAPAQVRWTLPPQWVEQPAGGMRVGSFTVTGQNGAKADISIIPIQGKTGGELDNVNRWRGQVGLPPVAAADLPKLTENVVIGSVKAHLFDMVGEKPGDAGPKKERAIAALLESSGTTWYFKITGEDSLVTAQKPAFVQFLKSLSFASADHHEDHPPVAAQAEAAAAPASGQPAWTVPPGWVAEAPGSMITAAFGVGTGGADAKVTVSVFPGDVGGTFANINRWRRQVGLDPVAESALPQHIVPLDVAGSSAVLADMKGPKARMVAVIVPQTGRTWFYKMLGNEQAVGREKDAFVKFVSSVRYSNDR